MSRAFRDIMWNSGQYIFGFTPEDKEIYKRLRARGISDWRGYEYPDAKIMENLSKCTAKAPHAKLVELQLRKANATCSSRPS